MATNIETKDVIIDMSNTPLYNTLSNNNTLTTTAISYSYNYGLLDLDIARNDYDNNDINEKSSANLLQSVCNFLKKYLPNSITNESGLCA